MNNLKHVAIACATVLMMAFAPLAVNAQIGEYRNDFAVGGSMGLALSSVGFTPTVPQGLHTGITAGVSARYVCEKYYSMICSVMGEVNFAAMGWNEDILDRHDQRVVNAETGKPEEYSRTINYIQIPVFAHLAWGREVNGMNFFFQAGPQIGFYLGESSSANFNIDSPNITDRVNHNVEQYKMDVENTFDYGIAGGLGVEYSKPGLGHLMLEGRYYYGLGNIYGSSKRDYFGKSNLSGIMVKLTYLFDLKTTSKSIKRK